MSTPHGHKLFILELSLRRGLPQATCRHTADVTFRKGNYIFRLYYNKTPLNFSEAMTTSNHNLLPPPPQQYFLHADYIQASCWNCTYHPVLTFEMDTIIITIFPELWNLSKVTQQGNNGATLPMQTTHPQAHILNHSKNVHTFIIHPIYHHSMRNLESPGNFTRTHLFAQMAAACAQSIKLIILTLT